jgi:hypothetical protein
MTLVSENVKVTNDTKSPVITKQITREYNVNFASYVQSQFVDSNCSEILFINNGTSNVLLNSTLVLAPNASFSGDGKAGEIDVTRYNIVFAPGGINNCVVVRKFYND